MSTLPVSEPERAERGCLAVALGLSHAQAVAAWEAARAVAHANGEPGPRSVELLDVAAHALGVAAGEQGDPAAAFTTPGERRALVDALVIAACIEGEVTLPGERAVLGLARELGVRSHWAELLPALRQRKGFAVKRALALRSPDARRLFRRTWREEGVLGILRAFAFVLGLHRDDALAARFRALAECPEGTFGHAVTVHFREHGITFPGEKNGIPERMIHHDLMHVINGYDTDPAGECELAAFYAASLMPPARGGLPSADGDPFTFIVVALATFHLELAVSPAAVKPARGAFDPERALAAFLRGRSLGVDVMGAWDYWALMPLPMDRVQASLGVAPPQPRASRRTDRPVTPARSSH